MLEHSIVSNSFNEHRIFDGESWVLTQKNFIYSSNKCISTNPHPLFGPLLVDLISMRIQFAIWFSWQSFFMNEDLACSLSCYPQGSNWQIRFFATYCFMNEEDSGLLLVNCLLMSHNLFASLIKQPFTVPAKVYWSFLTYFHAYWMGSYHSLDGSIFNLQPSNLFASGILPMQLLTLSATG